MAKKDKAVATAIDILEGLVCECGHINSEHFLDQSCSTKGCRCRTFTPVRFTVERAS